ncbi:MAG: hypothetical protein H6R17_1881 [Proteobacteria bacterium]|nr:hypothetical protein [Pseudomonadota bacterium]
MNAKNSVCFKCAVLLWLVAFTYIAVGLGGDPYHRSMTPSYHEAVAHWWAGQPVYTGPAGFNYLPVFLLFFSAFDGLPLVVGEIAWRFLAFAGLALGLWRCISLFVSDAREQTSSFALATALLLPMAFSTLRNGQSSAHLAACLLWAFCCIGQQKWTGATIWLCLSLVCKPLGLPALGLAAMAFPQLRGRAVVGLVVVLLLPYVFNPASYVNQIYLEFWQNIVDCSDAGVAIGDRTFADLNGVLRIVGPQLTGTWALWTSALAGVAMAALSLLLAKCEDKKISGLYWLSFAGGYIMLFTPMNELNSYVMLAPALSLWAVCFQAQRDARSFYAMLFMAITIIALPDLVAVFLGKEPGFEFGKSWCPLLTLIFLGVLTQRLIAMRER